MDLALVSRSLIHHRPAVESVTPFLREFPKPFSPFPSHHSITPSLQSPVKIRIMKIMSKIKIKKRQGCSRVHAKCHGLARVVSRVDAQKRPVFIGLSRCHGSRPLGSPLGSLRFEGGPSPRANAALPGTDDDEDMS
jgi:hypothetical protein